MLKMWRRRTGVLLLLLLVAAVGLWPVGTRWDDGLWPLSVTVVSESGAEITSVSCQAFSGPKGAESILEDLAPPDGSLYSAVQEPFRGEALVVRVPTSERTRSALLWSSRRYGQFRQLVVIVQYRGGRREGRMVEIPDLRENRAVTVMFP
jgi:hypothetical protein